MRLHHHAGTAGRTGGLPSVRPFRRRARAVLVTLALVGGLQGGLVTAAQADPAASLCSSVNGPFGSAVVGGGRYRIMPDEWNSAAEVCMTSDGGPNFTVTRSDLSSATNTKPGAPGAYTRIEYVPRPGELPTPVATMGDALTGWRTTTGVPGQYNAAYDLWYADAAEACGPTTSHELMIWLDRQGGPVPLGTATQQVALGGRTYQVHQYQNAANGKQVISYLATSPVGSVYALNLRAITNDAVVRGYVPADGKLCSVQAGFEIWNGGAGLATNSFSYQPAVGLPTGNVTSGLPGKCLDAGNNSAGPETFSMPADIWDCATTPNQTWTVGNDGTVRALGKCLDVTGGGTVNGTPVQLYPCNGTGAQVWRQNAKGLQNPQSGLCLADPAASTTNGTQLILWTCGASGQDWRHPYSGQPLWTAFTNKATSYCLSGGVENAGSVSLHTCGAGTTPPQNWQLVKDGTLRVSTGACLDAGSAGTAGSPVQLAPCSGSATQQWLLSPTGYLLNPVSGKCLDDPQSTAVQGVPLNLWTCNGTAAQVWYSAA
ncbi:ricin-type beta-trefoil lectin domain protein [Kitasatospora sp. NPDC058201]|uniref:ricin-type beta-trefoil lectin domain protein n=1 Tax=Streptomycetaceae TaxID=2062 RepID=UPI002E77A211|nr:ricin-type beta-trefoil lectin domain protein [Streptomyces sp. BE303]MED7947700.1 ricin-type beta-trefoil lectin domain protein [Streptomyces sp. BE303]